MKEELLSPAELREKLGISQATYFRWLREGRLKGVLVGRRRRFPPRVLDELRQDPDQAMQRKNELGATIEIAAERVVRTGLKKKEIEAILQNAKSEGESIAALLLEHALRKHATDLHLEPVADGLAVRERVHGILRPVDKPLPRGAQEDVIGAIKRMAGMDLSVTTQPQDARFFAPHEGRKVDVFCSLYPTALGESLCLRLLDPANVSLSFGKTGFSKRIQDGVREAIRPGKGVFLVTGPTGCGKTTTIYTLLADLNKPGVKIMTIEDPVEFRIDGILQAELRDLGKHQRAMMAMLRADLDIGYVSEMRDAETLELLFSMAATGHKMFSCLHVGNAVSALSRVLEITKESAAIVPENLLGILNQRLIPLTCSKCRIMKPISAAHVRRLGLAGEDFPVAHNAGCEACDGTGVLGRTAVGELLTITPILRKALQSGAKSVDDLRKALPPDYRDLRADVIDRLRAGDVSPESAIQVLS